MQKKIISFLIVLFVLSSAYLLWTAKNYNDPDYQKNWWAIYFEDPKLDDPNFVIENHSDQINFHYNILDGSNKIGEKDISIGKGETKHVKIENINLINKKITVQVISGDEKKEIYKNIYK
jgi:hypothetical protein